MSQKVKLSKVEEISRSYCKTDLPDFQAGDTLRVHNRIVEGSKERIQVFEGIVIKRCKKSEHPSATFTVRKVSYNIGVERTFFLHSPRIEKIELMKKGVVRRARLFYLRPLRGKAARIKNKFHATPKKQLAAESGNSKENLVEASS